MNICSIIVFYEFLFEEVVLWEVGELYFFKFIVFVDMVQYERLIMFKVLRSELGFLDWDVMNVFDGIELELRMMLVDGVM